MPDIFAGLIGNYRKKTNTFVGKIHFYLMEIIYKYFFYNAVPFMTVLTKVLRSMVMLTFTQPWHHSRNAHIVYLLLKERKSSCQYKVFVPRCILYFNMIQFPHSIAYDCQDI